jgi:hypothetical protein
MPTSPTPANTTEITVSIDVPLSKNGWIASGLAMSKAA